VVGAVNLGRKDPASIVLRVEADKSQRNLANQLPVSRSRTRRCCALLTHLVYFVRLGTEYIIQGLYMATSTSRAESQSLHRHKSLRTLKSNENSTNLARPHESLEASLCSIIQQSAALISSYRLGTRARETCSTYIEVSLQRRQHQMTEVLEGSTPLGKVGRLGCCSRRVAPLKMASLESFLLPLVTLPSTQPQIRSVKSPKDSYTLKPPASYSLMFVRTRCPSKRDDSKVGLLFHFTRSSTTIVQEYSVILSISRTYDTSDIYHKR
jgi:hypothetical protein